MDVHSALRGKRVAAFESRRGTEICELIRAFGGEPLSAPLLEEAPVEDAHEARSFGVSLLAGEFAAVFFLTGVGARTLLELLDQTHGADAVSQALAGIRVVARGPKPVKALRERGIQISLIAPEPNTWREVMAEVAAAGWDLHGCRIAIQEYGAPEVELEAALAAAGAAVDRVPVYRWRLPTDLTPAQETLRRMDRGEVDAALFTSAVQVQHLAEVAATMDPPLDWRSALRGVLIASLGPTCANRLRAEGLEPTVVPTSPRMGHLVRALAEYVMNPPETLPATAAPPDEAALPAWHDSAFLKACRREPTPYTPIWLMRQAGRYQPEYRELRSRVSFLELCKSPELVAEVTAGAARQIGADAAILFADILLIVEPLGLGLEYSKGDGPVITPPVRDAAGVDRLREVDPSELEYVYAGVRATRAALDPHLPLIGFCGAPFTVASYVVEGSGSRSFEHTKRLMYTDAGAWHALLARITRGLIGYCNAQIEAGAQCIQLFDSWVGCLSPLDYREYVQPHSRALIAGIRPGTPVIHFGTGTATLLPDIRDAGGDVIGVDWRSELDEAWNVIGHDRAVQGNLEPLTLMAEPEFLIGRAKRVLDQAGGRPGHIFNLGHGILPATPLDNVIRLIDAVHELSAR